MVVEVPKNHEETVAVTIINPTPSPPCLTYAFEPNLRAEEFIDCLERSTLALRRPVSDLGRMTAMLSNASVIATARNPDGLLVGVARSISDFAFCTYVSDLAVDVAYQRQGVGRELLRRTHEQAGVVTRLILLAAPGAVTYYPHIGMEQHPSAWTIAPRESE